ncbi:hypothetical protein L7F22_067530 [Adiantum nelumboides]|nr:hypothetical protein [Adiantum nelumboides]
MLSIGSAKRYFNEEDDDLGAFDYDLQSDVLSTEFPGEHEQQVSLLRQGIGGADRCIYREELDFDSYSSHPTDSCRHSDLLQAQPSPSSSTGGTSNEQEETCISLRTNDVASASTPGSIPCTPHWPTDLTHNYWAGDSVPWQVDTLISLQSPATCWMNKAGATTWVPANHRELLYRTAAMQPVALSDSAGESKVPSPGGICKPRRNIVISKDPQSVAARQRRRRISEKIRVLQRLVPGGTKLDTAAMLEEVAQYVKFLKAEVEKVEAMEDWMSLKAAAGPNLIDMHVVAPNRISPPSICLSGIQRF